MCVSLFIQYAVRMRRVILSSVASLALQYFSTLSHKRYDFRKKKVTEHKVCVYIFSRSFVWNISHSKNNCDRYEKKNNIGLHLKYPSLTSDFNEAWIFPIEFRKLSDNFRFHENPSSASQAVPCGRADGRTGIMNRIVAFRNFAKSV